MTERIPIQLTQRNAKLATWLIDQWQDRGDIPSELGERLHQGIESIPFNWRKLAQVSLLTAALCLIVSVAALVFDEKFVEFLKKIFDQPDWIRSLGFAAGAAAMFVFGFRRQKTDPKRRYSNETILFLGAIAVAASVYFLGRFLDDGSRHYSLLVLLACGVYASVALAGRSDLVWIFALISLGGWFGAETGYLSGWGAYYFGMNYPLRFVLFGAVLCGCSWGMGRLPHFALFSRATLAMGLIYLFMALWLLSIFGDFGDMASWRVARQIELFHWSVLFAAASGAAIWHGLRFDDPLTDGFGRVFLFINIYTRFFEFFWDGIHKSIFFFLLALTLWLVGRKAERIWTLGRRR